VAEDVVTLYGKTYRAVVVHSSSQDQRRHKRLVRLSQNSRFSMFNGANRLRCFQ
jgi:hypothetical protein